MKRSRPHIPFKVRCTVLARQIYESGQNVPGREEGETLSALVARWRKFLFGDAPNDLHHRPALINRMYHSHLGEYSPAANDPAHLVYLEKHEHHIETNVRGQGALRSDTAARMHQRRMDENRGKRKRRPKAKIVARKNPWPNRGARKFGRQR